MINNLNPTLQLGTLKEFLQIQCDLAKKNMDIEIYTLAVIQ